MILKKLEIHNYGPFSHPVTIDFEPTVTVLTGRNDSGKSLIIRLLQLIHGHAEAEAKASDRNSYRDDDAPRLWDKDNTVKAIATYVLGENYKFFAEAANIRESYEIDIEFILTRGRRQVIRGRTSTGQEISPNKPGVIRMPKILALGEIDLVSPEFSLAEVKSGTLENVLLTISFGKGYGPKLDGWSQNKRKLNQQKKKANQKLNELFKPYLPENLGLSFSLETIIEDGAIVFSTHFEDKFGADTPVNYRGSGIQKILSLIITLLDSERMQEQLLVLADEPENALHPDAQRLLRGVLENLADAPNIQVVYATHSATMLNVNKPSGIRMLRRTEKNQKATSEIVNKPYLDNFRVIRRELGILPVDSLIYADLVIVTEGASEKYCLIPLLEKLSQGHQEFAKLKTVLPFITALDAGGSSWPYQCDQLDAFGVKHLVFVDGDKKNELENPRLSPDLIKIHLPMKPQRIEFEQVIPEEIYFQALEKIVPGATYENYQSWLKQTTPHPQMMFSKRVNKWLNDEFNTDLDKPLIMKEAVKLVKPDQVQHIEQLRQLADAIVELMKSEGE